MNGTRKRRLAFWGTVGSVVLAGLVAAFLPQPVRVDLALASRGPLQVTLDHEGQTRVRQRYVVSAPVPGRVRRIELEPGDAVVAGKTVVASFEPAAPVLLDERTRAQAAARAKSAEAALLEARAQRDRAATVREQAALERDRARRLHAEGLLTAQARQAAEAEAEAAANVVAAAEWSVRAAAAELDAARAALLEPRPRARGAAPARLTLRAPIDGVVLRRMHESETDVPQGEPLLEVADLSTLEVMADYLSSDAVRIRPGTPALIEQWGGGSALRATVRRVEPSGFLKISALGVEEQRVWVILEFGDSRQASQLLGAGYRVEARIIVFEQPDVLRVPVASLFRSGEGWAVFVASGGRASLRRIGIGQRNGAAAEVTGGLTAGERVIVHPPDGVSDGVRIVER